MTFLIVFDMNFLQSRQQTAPYFRGLDGFVIESHTLHTSDVVKMDDEFVLDGELRLRENGLLIALESRSCELPKLPKVES